MIVISPLFKVKTNFNIKEKDLVCLISCISLHFEKWAGNQSKWVKLKTDTHRANEWNIEAVFFFSQERNGFHKTSSVVTNMSWYLLRYKNHWIELPLIYLTIFLPFDHKWYLEPTNNCTRRFTRHNLFDANWHTLVKWYGCFFHQAFPKASWQHGQ